MILRRAHAAFLMWMLLWFVTYSDCEEDKHLRMESARTFSKLHLPKKSTNHIESDPSSFRQVRNHAASQKNSGSNNFFQVQKDITNSESIIHRRKRQILENPAFSRYYLPYDDTYLPTLKEKRCRKIDHRHHFLQQQSKMYPNPMANQNEDDVLLTPADVSHEAKDTFFDSWHPKPLPSYQHYKINGGNSEEDSWQSSEEFGRPKLLEIGGEYTNLNNLKKILNVNKKPQLNKVIVLDEPVLNKETIAPKPLLKEQNVSPNQNPLSTLHGQTTLQNVLVHKIQTPLRNQQIAGTGYPSTLLPRFQTNSEIIHQNNNIGSRYWNQNSRMQNVPTSITQNEVKNLYANCDLQKTLNTIGATRKNIPPWRNIEQSVMTTNHPLLSLQKPKACLSGLPNSVPSIPVSNLGRDIYAEQERERCYQIIRKLCDRSNPPMGRENCFNTLKILCEDSSAPTEQDLITSARNLGQTDNSGVFQTKQNPSIFPGERRPIQIGSRSYETTSIAEVLSNIINKDQRNENSMTTLPRVENCLSQPLSQQTGEHFTVCNEIYNNGVVTPHLNLNKVYRSSQQSVGTENNTEQGIMLDSPKTKEGENGGINGSNIKEDSTTDPIKEEVRTLPITSRSFNNNENINNLKQSQNYAEIQNDKQFQPLIDLIKHESSFTNNHNHIPYTNKVYEEQNTILSTPAQTITPMAKNYIMDEKSFIDDENKRSNHDTINHEINTRVLTKVDAFNDPIYKLHNSNEKRSYYKINEVPYTDKLPTEETRKTNEMHILDPLSTISKETLTYPTNTRHAESTTTDSAFTKLDMPNIKEIMFSSTPRNSLLYSTNIINPERMTTDLAFKKIDMPNVKESNIVSIIPKETLKNPTNPASITTSSAFKTQDILTIKESMIHPTMSKDSLLYPTNTMNTEDTITASALNKIYKSDVQNTTMLSTISKNNLLYPTNIMNAESITAASDFKKADMFDVEKSRMLPTVQNDDLLYPTNIMDHKRITADFAFKRSGMSNGEELPSGVMDETHMQYVAPSKTANIMHDRMNIYNPEETFQLRFGRENDKIILQQNQRGFLHNVATEPHDTSVITEENTFNTISPTTKQTYHITGSNNFGQQEETHKYTLLQNPNVEDNVGKSYDENVDLNYTDHINKSPSNLNSEIHYDVGISSINQENRFETNQRARTYVANNKETFLPEMKFDGVYTHAKNEIQPENNIQNLWPKGEEYKYTKPMSKQEIHDEKEMENNYMQISNNLNVLNNGSEFHDIFNNKPSNLTSYTTNLENLNQKNTLKSDIHPSVKTYPIQQQYMRHTNGMNLDSIPDRETTFRYNTHEDTIETAIKSNDQNNLPINHLLSGKNDYPRYQQSTVYQTKEEQHDKKPGHIKDKKPQMEESLLTSSNTDDGSHIEKEIYKRQELNKDDSKLKESLISSFDLSSPFKQTNSIKMTAATPTMEIFHDGASQITPTDYKIKYDTDPYIQNYVTYATDSKIPTLDVSENEKPDNTKNIYHIKRSEGYTSIKPSLDSNFQNEMSNEKQVLYEKEPTYRNENPTKNNLNAEQIDKNNTYDKSVKEYNIEKYYSKPLTNEVLIESEPLQVTETLNDNYEKDKTHQKFFGINISESIDTKKQMRHIIKPSVSQKTNKLHTTLLKNHIEEVESSHSEEENRPTTNFPHIKQSEIESNTLHTRMLKKHTEEVEESHSEELHRTENRPTTNFPDIKQLENVSEESNMLHTTMLKNHIKEVEALHSEELHQTENRPAINFPDIKKLEINSFLVTDRDKNQTGTKQNVDKETKFQTKNIKKNGLEDSQKNLYKLETTTNMLFHLAKAIQNEIDTIKTVIPNTTEKSLEKVKKSVLTNLNDIKDYSMNVSDKINHEQEENTNINVESNVADAANDKYKKQHKVNSDIVKFTNVNETENLASNENMYFKRETKKTLNSLYKNKNKIRLENDNKITTCMPEIKDAEEQTISNIVYTTESNEERVTEENYSTLESPSNSELRSSHVEISGTNKENTKEVIPTESSDNLIKSIYDLKNEISNEKQLDNILEQNETKQIKQCLITSENFINDSEENNFFVSNKKRESVFNNTANINNTKYIFTDVKSIDEYKPEENQSEDYDIESDINYLNNINVSNENTHIQKIKVMNSTDKYPDDVKDILQTIQTMIYDIVNERTTKSTILPIMDSLAISDDSKFLKESKRKQQREITYDEEENLRNNKKQNLINEQSKEEEKTEKTNTLSNKKDNASSSSTKSIQTTNFKEKNMIGNILEIPTTLYNIIEENATSILKDISSENEIKIVNNTTDAPQKNYPTYITDQTHYTTQQSVIDSLENQNGNVLRQTRTMNLDNIHKTDVTNNTVSHTVSSTAEPEMEDATIASLTSEMQRKSDRNTNGILSDTFKTKISPYTICLEKNSSIVSKNIPTLTKCESKMFNYTENKSNKVPPTDGNNDGQDLTENGNMAILRQTRNMPLQVNTKSTLLPTVGKQEMAESVASNILFKGSEGENPKTDNGNINSVIANVSEKHANYDDRSDELYGGANSKTKLASNEYDFKTNNTDRKKLDEMLLVNKNNHVLVEKPSRNRNTIKNTSTSVHLKNKQKMEKLNSRLQNSQEVKTMNIQGVNSITLNILETTPTPLYTLKNQGFNSKIGSKTNLTISDRKMATYTSDILEDVSLTRTNNSAYATDQDFNTNVTVTEDEDSRTMRLTRTDSYKKNTGVAEDLDTIFSINKFDSEQNTNTNIHEMQTVTDNIGSQEMTSENPENYVTYRSYEIGLNNNEPFEYADMIKNEGVERQTRKMDIDNLNKTDIQNIMVTNLLLPTNKPMNDENINQETIISTSEKTITRNTDNKNETFDMSIENYDEFGISKELKNISFEVIEIKNTTENKLEEMVLESEDANMLRKPRTMNPGIENITESEITPSRLISTKKSQMEGNTIVKEDNNNLETLSNTRSIDVTNDEQTNVKMTTPLLEFFANTPEIEENTKSYTENDDVETISQTTPSDDKLTAYFEMTTKPTFLFPSNILEVEGNIILDKEHEDTEIIRGTRTMSSQSVNRKFVEQTSLPAPKTLKNLKENMNANQKEEATRIQKQTGTTYTDRKSTAEITTLTPPPPTNQFSNGKKEILIETSTMYFDNQERGDVETTTSIYISPTNIPEEETKTFLNTRKEGTEKLKQTKLGLTDSKNKEDIENKSLTNKRDMKERTQAGIHTNSKNTEEFQNMYKKQNQSTVMHDKILEERDNTKTLSQVSKRGKDENQGITEKMHTVENKDTEQKIKSLNSHEISKNNFKNSVKNVTQNSAQYKEVNSNASFNNKYNISSINIIDEPLSRNVTSKRDENQQIKIMNETILNITENNLLKVLVSSNGERNTGKLEYVNGTKEKEKTENKGENMKRSDIHTVQQQNGRNVTNETSDVMKQNDGDEKLIIKTAKNQNMKKPISNVYNDSLKPVRLSETNINEVTNLPNKTHGESNKNNEDDPSIKKLILIQNSSEKSNIYERLEESETSRYMKNIHTNERNHFNRTIQNSSYNEEGQSLNNKEMKEIKTTSKMQKNDTDMDNLNHFYNNGTWRLIREFNKVGNNILRDTILEENEQNAKEYLKKRKTEQSREETHSHSIMNNDNIIESFTEYDHENTLSMEGSIFNKSNAVLTKNIDKPTLMIENKNCEELNESGLKNYKLKTHVKANSDERPNNTLNQESTKRCQYTEHKNKTKSVQDARIFDHDNKNYEKPQRSIKNKDTNFNTSHQTENRVQNNEKEQDEIILSEENVSKNKGNENILSINKVINKHKAQAPLPLHAVNNNTVVAKNGLTSDINLYDEVVQDLEDIVKYPLNISSVDHNKSIEIKKFEIPVTAKQLSKLQEASYTETKQNMKNDSVKNEEQKNIRKINQSTFAVNSLNSSNLTIGFENQDNSDNTQEASIIPGKRQAHSEVIMKITSPIKKKEERNKDSNIENKNRSFDSENLYGLVIRNNTRWANSTDSLYTEEKLLHESRDMKNKVENISTIGSSMTEDDAFYEGMSANSTETASGYEVEKQGKVDVSSMSTESILGDRDASTPKRSIQLFPEYRAENNTIRKLPHNSVEDEKQENILKTYQISKDYDKEVKGMKNIQHNNKNKFIKNVFSTDSLKTKGLANSNTNENHEYIKVDINTAEGINKTNNLMDYNEASNFNNNESLTLRNKIILLEPENEYENKSIQNITLTGENTLNKSNSSMEYNFPSIQANIPKNSSMKLINIDESDKDRDESVISTTDNSNILKMNTTEEMLNIFNDKSSSGNQNMNNIVQYSLGVTDYGEMDSDLHQNKVRIRGIDNLEQVTDDSTNVTQDLNENTNTTDGRPAEISYIDKYTDNTTMITNNNDSEIYTDLNYMIPQTDNSTILNTFTEKSTTSKEENIKVENKEMASDESTDRVTLNIEQENNVSKEVISNTSTLFILGQNSLFPNSTHEMQKVDMKHMDTEGEIPKINMYVNTTDKEYSKTMEPSEIFRYTSTDSITNMTGNTNTLRKFRMISSSEKVRNKQADRSQGEALTTTHKTKHILNRENKLTGAEKPSYITNDSNKDSIKENKQNKPGCNCTCSCLNNHEKFLINLSVLNSESDEKTVNDLEIVEIKRPEEVFFKRTNTKENDDKMYSMQKKHQEEKQNVSVFTQKPGNNEIFRRTTNYKPMVFMKQNETQWQDMFYNTLSNYSDAVSEPRNMFVRQSLKSPQFNITKDLDNHSHSSKNEGNMTKTEKNTRKPDGSNIAFKGKHEEVTNTEINTPNYFSMGLFENVNEIGGNTARVDPYFISSTQGTKTLYKTENNKSGSDIGILSNDIATDSIIQSTTESIPMVVQTQISEKNIRKTSEESSMDIQNSSYTEDPIATLLGNINDNIFYEKLPEYETKHRIYKSAAQNRFLTTIEENLEGMTPDSDIKTQLSVFTDNKGGNDSVKSVEDNILAGNPIFLNHKITEQNDKNIENSEDIKWNKLSQNNIMFEKNYGTDIGNILHNDNKIHMTEINEAEQWNVENNEDSKHSLSDSQYENTNFTHQNGDNESRKVTISSLYDLNDESKIEARTPRATVEEEMFTVEDIHMQQTPQYYKNQLEEKVENIPSFEDMITQHITTESTFQNYLGNANQVDNSHNRRGTDHNNMYVNVENRLDKPYTSDVDFSHNENQQSKNDFSIQQLQLKYQENVESPWYSCGLSSPQAIGENGKWTTLQEQSEVRNAKRPCIGHSNNGHSNDFSYKMITAGSDITNKNENSKHYISPYPRQIYKSNFPFSSTQSLKYQPTDNDSEIHDAKFIPTNSKDNKLYENILNEKGYIQQNDPIIQSEILKDNKESFPIYSNYFFPNQDSINKGTENPTILNYVNRRQTIPESPIQVLPDYQNYIKAPEAVTRSGVSFSSGQQKYRPTNEGLEAREEEILPILQNFISPLQKQTKDKFQPHLLSSFDQIKLPTKDMAQSTLHYRDYITEKSIASDTNSNFLFLNKVKKDQNNAQPITKIFPAYPTPTSVDRRFQNSMQPSPNHDYNFEKTNMNQLNKDINNKQQLHNLLIQALLPAEPTLKVPSKRQENLQAYNRENNLNYNTNYFPHHEAHLHEETTDYSHVTPNTKKYKSYHDRTIKQVPAQHDRLTTPEHKIKYLEKVISDKMKEYDTEMKNRQANKQQTSKRTGLPFIPTTPPSEPDFLTKLMHVLNTENDGSSEEVTEEPEQETYDCNPHPCTGYFSNRLGVIKNIITMIRDWIIGSEKNKKKQDFYYHHM